VVALVGPNGAGKTTLLNLAAGLNQGRVQVAGPVDHLIDTHRVLTGPTGEILLDGKGFAVLSARQANAQTHLLVRNLVPGEPTPAGWLAEPAGLTEIVLAYLRDPAASVLPVPVMAATIAGRPA
jgi:ABC-2 type transport system ATP-binding protein